MASTTLVRSESTPGIPAVDPSHHAAILDQVDRMVASPLFRHSKHYPALLRYVVDQSLKGRGAQLKERVLGFEVFGRDPNYDTNSDPVVRNSACEVRKRIAQYYLEAGHEAEIRIELPAGSYVPEFLYPEASAALVQPAQAVSAAPRGRNLATYRTGLFTKSQRGSNMSWDKTTFFEALESQPGLTVEPQVLPVKHLVIDSLNLAPAN